MSGRVRGPGRRRVVAGAGKWWHVTDLVVLAALVVVGSLLLVPAYGSTAPVAAAIVGAAVPAVVFAVLARWSGPWWAAVALIPCGVLVLGALVVAPQDRVLTILPSADAIAAVVRGSLDGWRDLLTVATPTGVTGGLLVPPLLIAAVGSTVAGVLVSTHRPASALIGPVVSALAFALFADVTADPWIVVVVAGALLVAGLGWVSWIGGRAARRAERAAAAQLARDRVSGADGALGLRRMLVAGSILTVAAVVAALVATGGTVERAALREVVQAPVDPTAFASPLALFRTYTKDYPDDVQLVVQGLPTGARLRLAALDDYDGRQFRLSDTQGPFVRIGPERAAAANTAPTEVTVQVRDYAGPFLPLPGAIVGLDFDGVRADQLAADLRYSAGASTGVLPAGWQPGDAYRVVAGVPAQPSVAQLATARPTAVAAPSGITVPDVLRSAMDRYIAGMTTPAAQVEAIRAGLAEDGYFSHGTAGEPTSPAGHGLDRLIGMVGNGSMVGDQEQYAALMAVMVRSLGIPARVVVGFAPTGSTDGTVELRGRDITAWVEVPFDGFGWVAFDPTPSPDKPLTDDQERTQTERREVAVEVPPALPQVLPDTVDTDSTDQQPQDEAAPPPAAADNFMPALLLAMFGWTLLVLAVFAAPIVTILVIKSLRRRRRLAAARPADRITGGWQELVDTAVDLGYRPATWHTRSEVAHDLAGAGVLQVDWLAPAADAAQFSPTPVDDERARSYWREVDDRSAELLGGLGFWRRWRARLSLASLRHRNG
ncbi:MAG TPA: transglutaminase-like domain-containing protein [Nakamurella sp.]